MRVRTLLDLRAMQDGGRLVPTFEDVINGLEAARTWRGEDVNKSQIDEDHAIRCIEDACRKRMAQYAKEYESFKAGGPSFMANDTMAALSVARKQSL